VNSSDLHAVAARVRAIILDVDGVMTDGSIILDNHDNEYKSFHVRDGHAVKLAVRAGILTAIITGRRSQVVQRRAEELGIQEVHQKVHDKLAVYEELKRKYGFTDEEACYMGDDVVDLSLLRVVGLPATPSDADPAARDTALFVARSPGGRGAVRELIETVLRARGDWERLIAMPGKSA